MPVLSRFLRYFLAVGRHGSIRRAADELGISPSAVDRQILNVEAELGLPLFERLPTGLRLTAAGEIMMAAGHRWQKNLADVRAQIEDLQGLKRGHVDIALIEPLAKGWAPALLRSIRSRHPGIGIGIRVMDNDAVRAAITGGEVDFGILFDPQSWRDLSVRAFTEVALGFVTPPGHALAREEARFSACAGMPLILPAEPLVPCAQIAVLEGATSLTVDRAMTADSVQMIASLVMEGAGIGIATEIDVMTEVAQGLLHFTRISDPILRPLTLALCTATAGSPSYAANMVLAEMEAGFVALGQGAAATA
jgi:DNA-binding transcriptional LysR family regulator